MTMEVNGDLFFRIVLVPICSFSAFATLSCPQRSEVGTGKTFFYLCFAFLGLCRISLEMRLSALYPAVFPSLLAWTEFLVSTQICTQISLSRKSLCCQEQSTTGSHLLQNFYREGTPLSPIGQGLAQERTTMLSEGNSLFSSVDSLFLNGS